MLKKKKQKQFLVTTKSRILKSFMLRLKSFNISKEIAVSLKKFGRTQIGLLSD